MVEEKKERVKGQYMIDALVAIKNLVGDTEQGRFYQAKINNAKPIKLTSVNELFSEEELKHMCRVVKPAMHGCFVTAQRLSMYFGFEYVEGEWGIGGFLGVEHAFNRIDDKYFDFTSELVLGKNVEEEEFISIAEFSKDFVSSVCMELKVFSALIPYKYQRDKNLDYE